MLRLRSGAVVSAWRDWLGRRVVDGPFRLLEPVVRDDFVHGVIEASELGEWTVFISSHDIEEVERLADHVALLESGRLKFAETTEALLGRFRRIEVTLQSGSAALDAVPAGWLELQREGDLVRFFDAQY